MKEMKEFVSDVDVHGKRVQVKLYFSSYPLSSVTQLEAQSEN